jgi:HEAT repeat protein
MFDHYAKHEPLRLLQLLDPAGGLRGPLLTFAAEAAGAIRSLPVEVVVDALEPLLLHEKAYVREGTVYGLAQLIGQLGGTRAKELLKRVVREDDSQGVREAARDALGTLPGKSQAPA